MHSPLLVWFSFVWQTVSTTITVDARTLFDLDLTCGGARSSKVFVISSNKKSLSGSDHLCPDSCCGTEFPELIKCSRAEWGYVMGSRMSTLFTTVYLIETSLWVRGRVPAPPAASPALCQQTGGVWPAAWAFLKTVQLSKWQWHFHNASLGSSPLSTPSVSPHLWMPCSTTSHRGSIVTNTKSK